MFEPFFTEQSSPEYPVLHKHFPSDKQVPYLLQSFKQVLVSQAVPLYPVLHAQIPALHVPFPLQFYGQVTTVLSIFYPQSNPVHPELQTQVASL